jgi:hypothetical protein
VTVTVTARAVHAGSASNLSARAQPQSIKEVVWCGESDGIVPSRLMKINRLKEMLAAANCERLTVLANKVIAINIIR